MPKMTEKAKATEPVSVVIYLGPPIMGVATPGTIYKNGLTTQLQEAVKEFPALKMLLVEIGSVAAARKDLKKEETAISVCYREAEAYAKRRGAKG